MNQDKLDMVKQEMERLERLNINIVEISELKWTAIDDFNSLDHCIYYYGKNPLEEME